MIINEKVICIKNTDKICQILHYLDDNLTIGKEYDAEYITEYQKYLILNDKNSYIYYPIEWFITVEEYRDKRLKELGI